MKRFCLAVASCVALLSSARADTTLVFNELMYHPATNEPALEWVEFYNQLAVDIDVSGWQITGDIGFTFPANSRVAGRSYLVVAINPAALLATMAQTNVTGPFTGRLSNAGASVRLRNNAGRLMDEIDYGTSGGWPVAPDGGGVSLAKRDRDFGSRRTSNWTWSGQTGGTPGTENFPGAGSPAIALINIDSSWRYEASGTDLGTGWRAPGFDDSAWAQRNNLTNRAIPGLFNTGVDNNGVSLADGANDPHYIMSYNANGAAGIPATVSLNNAAWLANDSASKWISVVNNGNTTINGGGYGYQTTFSLAGFLLGTVRVNFQASCDNAMTNVFLNAVAQNMNFTGFASYSSPFTLSSGFNSGNNTLEFGTENQGAGPGAFRALVSGTGLSVNTNSPLPIGPTTYYFRRGFNFFGNPQATTLTINPVVADGAVFYLNGVEVYRQNMPGGAVSYGTAALSDVTTPAYAGLISIAASNLVVGANVLAVEVHQAAGSADAAIFGTELNFTPQSLPPVPLAFNELAASTNATNFFLELINHGTNALALDGMIVRRDSSATNQEYVIPNGTTLAAGAFLVVSNDTLGFAPANNDKLFLYAANRAVIHDAVSVTRGARARTPDGTGRWLLPNAPTPGAANTFSFNNDVVINEIMYHHKLRPFVSSNTPPEADNEAWIELYNRGTNAVNLTGWSFTDGIDYRFPSNTVLAAGAYLIVAKDADELRAKYPSLTIIGNFDGNLSHSDDELVLSDAAGNPADEVHYRDGGRWPEYADGDGSSLELRDPFADNAKGEAWAASDETGKSGWGLYKYSAVAQPSITANPDAQWREFVFGLLGAGECLIDDLVVVQNPGANQIQYLANGDFTAGLTGWRVLGTHGRSRVIAEPGNPGNNVLHLIATGPQEHMHNHIETTLPNGRAVTNGQTYEISFRAKWLAGNGLLNTRLYFNRVARTTELVAPANNGTPGAVNSRYATNIGPTFASLAHSPVAPATNQPVTVTINAQDAQGVASAQVFWSVNGGAFQNTNMTAGAGGNYSATLPGLAGATLVQFYVRATDGAGAVATFPAAGPDSGVFYKVADGLPNLTLAHNIRILMSPANTALMHADTNVMSNASQPCTVVYDERIAYYDMGVRLKSSERGRNDAARVGFQIQFPNDQPFRGAHPVMLCDRSGGGGRPTGEESTIRHMMLRSGVAAVNFDIIRILAPQAAQNGPALMAPRFEDEFIQTAFTDNGGDGTFYEMELIYYPTTVNGAGYKLPQPDAVQGMDMTDAATINAGQGTFKEAYRYNHIIKNNRDSDDYAQFMAFARPWALTGAALDAQTRQMMDVDQWMRAYALVTLCGVGDMYSFGNNHNHMMYIRSDNHRGVYLPWDMDFSYTRANNATLVGDQNIAKIVNLTGNLRLLYAHILDHLDTTFNTAYMTYWLAHYGPFAGQNYSANGAYIQARGDFARSTITGAGGLAAFSVGAAGYSSGASNVVTITGTAPVTMKTIWFNGAEYPITWTSLNAWTARVPVPPGVSSVSIQTLGVQGQVLTNALVTATNNAVLDSPIGKLVINEIMFNAAVAGGEYLEIFNASSNTTFDLSFFRVNGLGYTFPAGSYLAPQSFLVLAKNRSVFAYTYGNAVPVFDEFSGDFQRGGETISLVQPGANPSLDVVIDAVRYEGELPWPATAADGTGSSYQLIDPRQDNSRAGNWYARHTPAVSTPEISTPATPRDGWRFFSVSGNIGTGDSAASGVKRLWIFLGEAGSALIDDISLVEGPVAETGYNYVRNGNFESPLDTGLTNSWILGTYSTNTVIVSNLVHAGNGALLLSNGAAGQANPPNFTRLIQQFLSPAPTNNLNMTLSFWYWATNSATNLYSRIRNTSFLQTATNSGATNINIFITPSNYVPPVLLSPATNSLTPGRTNDALAALPAFPSLWLNEVQPENITGLFDGQGEREPWVEIYNASTNTVSLEGLFLTHTYTNLTNWAFPPGSSIGPTQFLVVFCDGETNETSGQEYHTSFTLPASSGGLGLSRLHNDVPQVIDYLNYAGVHAGRSFGSFPDGQSFDRQEFFYVTPGGTNDGRSAPLIVFINELMAQNGSSLADPADGQFEDWFELYNPGTNAVNLAGYFLTDVLTNKFKFQITTNMAHIIPPGGHLLVWADNEIGQNMVAGVPRPDLHVNFSLAVGGEQLGLYAADGTAIDEVSFLGQINDVSLGRYPDGASTFYFMPGTMTPRAANQIATPPNTAPVLDPIGDKILFLGQSLAFTATATDSDVPAQLLNFTLDAVPPAGASITGAGALTWTPSAIGTNSITVRVTDDGTPALDASETITVEVLAAPSFSTSLRNGDNVELTWRSRAGKKYAVDYKDDLNTVPWTPLWTNTALGDSLTFTNIATNSPQRFYRIRTVD